MANRLRLESSPYLLQHKDNPVDWFAWGDEAFATAKSEDKPIFLSIGYSTCHWCHVMEHESFEDDDVADLLNDGFVSIKVDREERPDVDNVYMSVCQLVGGQCGWPLTVIMTPDAQPFFVGTYFPKNSRGGRIGVLDLLPKITGAWVSDRNKVIESAGNITEAVTKLSVTNSGRVDPDWSEIALSQFAKSFDRRGGGFGGRPKFPSAHNLLFLMSAETLEADSLTEMVPTTLDRMATGGFHDHVGGGFHRYSTDAEWRLPHFEKMLYDQAMLIMAYTEARQLYGLQRFQDVAVRGIAYLERDLRSADGSFYAAEDADSEGVEGKFYVWTREEFDSIVSSPQLRELFDIRDSGNFEDEASGQYTGENVLHMTKVGVPPKPDDPLYSGSTIRALNDLLEVRSERIRPSLDDKILTDWNGLTIAALAKAGRAFGRKDFIESAAQAARNVLKPFDQVGELFHTSSKDKPIPAFLDDYAFLLWGTIELYQATLEPVWLEYSRKIAAKLHSEFSDKESGAMFLVGAATNDLIVRPMDFSDGALPSGNAIAAYCFARLYRLTGDIDWDNKAVAVMEAAAGHVGRYPSAFGGMLLAAAHQRHAGKEIVVVGSRDDAFVAEVLRLVDKKYDPFTVIHLLDPDNMRDSNRLMGQADYLSVFEMSSVNPEVYICNNFACQLPISSIQAFENALADATD